MKVEILAPGGSREAIYAGLYCGADAVYTGTNRFSARAFADNPDVEELCQIIDFAHLHSKKIYLTVNTLLTEEELEGSLFEILKPLYKAGLDAVIVQDFGVMDFVNQNFPGLDIHASTQMTLVSGEAANLLKPYGVTRVVPARELSIQEISTMRRTTDLELEVFVHGALCYCYSGQCLMSQVIGGRSGNRGMCAQPCRLPYDVDGKPAGYILSTKDLCTLEHTGELIEAGVNSFKIEGRMKKPSYTALTSYLYRTYADAYLSGVKIENREVQRDITKLQDIYNRGGFSGGYLFEKSKKKIIYPQKNSHFGVCVGEITAVNKEQIRFRAEREIAYQDVLEFRDECGERVYEYTAGDAAMPGQEVETRYQRGCKPQKGQKVYRTKNHALLHETQALINEGQVQMKIAVQGRFVGRVGQPVTLEVSAEGLTCVVQGAMAEKATGRPVTGEDIEKRLRKTGGSEYTFVSLETQIEDSLFLPLGSLAGLRRSAFAAWQESFLSRFRKKLAMQTNITDNSISDGLPEKTKSAFTIIQISNFSHIKGVKSVSKANAYNTRLHLKLDAFDPTEWSQLAEEAGAFSYYISLPAVLRPKNREKFLENWKKFGDCFCRGNCVGVIAGTVEACSVFERICEPGWELMADTSMYMWNQRSKKVYRQMGIQNHLYMAYGRTAVMITEGCVGMQLYGCAMASKEQRHIEITTPKQDKFMVANVCDYCYNVIYEKQPDWHKSEDLGDVPELAFTFEDTQEVRKVLEQWNYLS